MTAIISSDPVIEAVGRALIIKLKTGADYKTDIFGDYSFGGWTDKLHPAPVCIPVKEFAETAMALKNLGSGIYFDDRRMVDDRPEYGGYSSNIDSVRDLGSSAGYV